MSATGGTTEVRGQQTAEADRYPSRRGMRHDAARRTTWSPRIVFWTSMVAFFVLTGSWAFASPLTSAPDEPTHLTKSAAVVRGQFIGHEERPGYFIVQLPVLYDAIDELPACYKFQPQIPASCSRLPEGELSGSAPSDHTAGSYNPVYYGIVGLATLGPDRVFSLYLVRLLSAALVSFTLALAMRTAAELPRPGWALTGTLLGVTPMVAFLGGSVNPNALEASAAIGLWVTLAALLLAPRQDLVLRRMLRAGVLVALLSNAKPLSLLMLAVIVLACVFAAPWSRTWSVLRDRRAWPGLGLGVAGSAAALAWLAWVGRLSSASEVQFPELTPPVAAEIVLRESSDYVTNMLGQFGWVDTDLPPWLYMLLGGLVLVVVLVGVASGSTRERTVLGLVALLVAVLPLALQVPTATVSGIPWQGRYLLAVAAGLPALAGVVIATRARSGEAGLLRRLACILAVLWASGQVTSFLVALRRYAVGISHPYFEVAADPWLPPWVPWPVLVASCAVASGLLAYLVLRADREVSEDAPAGPPQPGLHPGVQPGHADARVGSPA